MELGFRDILIIISVVVIIAIYLNGRRKIHKEGKNPIKLKSTKVEEPDPSIPDRDFGPDGFDQFGVGIPKPIHLDDKVPEPSAEQLQAMKANQPPLASDDELYAQAPTLRDFADIDVEQPASASVATTMSSTSVDTDTAVANHSRYSSPTNSNEQLSTESREKQSQQPTVDSDDLFAGLYDFDIADDSLKADRAGASAVKQSAYQPMQSTYPSEPPKSTPSTSSEQQQALFVEQPSSTVHVPSAVQNVDTLPAMSAYDEQPNNTSSQASEHSTSVATAVQSTPSHAKREQIEIDFDKSQQRKKAELEQEVLALSVVMPENRQISGAELLPCFLTLGLKYGEMHIFHRHQDNAGTGEVTFSVANMVNPGTFDLDNMEQFSTRGVTMFMTLPNVGDAQTVFKQMLNAAKKIATEFGGQVLDGQRSVMTRQTEQHYMSKIREFDRRARLAGY